MAVRLSGGGVLVALLALAVDASAQAVSIPTSYRAVTNRVVYPEPTLPMLGPAGFRFTDPTFVSRMLRVTDAGTDTRAGFAGAVSRPRLRHLYPANPSVLLFVLWD